MLQICWLIMWSMARVRRGGTSALPVVKLIDVLTPGPPFTVRCSFSVLSPIVPRSEFGVN
jgi:hypothetical protein